MPTYDYRCDACGEALEIFQSMTEAPKRKCPRCGKPRLRRLIGAGGGLIFKGSGFYLTDYRSDSYKKAAAAETSGSAEKAGEGGAKSASDGSSKAAEGGASKPAAGDAKPLKKRKESA
jgi:putative FmdB family regulatory protein